MWLLWWESWQSRPFELWWTRWKDWRPSAQRLKWPAMYVEVYIHTFSPLPVAVWTMALIHGLGLDALVNSPHYNITEKRSQNTEVNNNIGNMCVCEVCLTTWYQGYPAKGPYLPCVNMAGRALLAGYPRYVRHISQNVSLLQILSTNMYDAWYLWHNRKAVSWTLQQRISIISTWSHRLKLKSLLVPFNQQRNWNFHWSERATP